MSLIKDLILTCTVISFFSIIIMNLIGENNPQKEVLRIGLGSVMILSVLSKLTNADIKFMSIDDIWNDYTEISTVATDNAISFQKDYISMNLENYILETLGVKCEISVNDSFEIIEVLVFDENYEEEVSELLGINLEKIEYIESR